jgi:hypothetical protein
VSIKFRDFIADEDIDRFLQPLRMKVFEPREIDRRGQRNWKEEIIIWEVITRY